MAKIIIIEKDEEAPLDAAELLMRKKSFQHSNPFAKR
jgi:hypothetical protein